MGEGYEVAGFRDLATIFGGAFLFRHCVGVFSEECSAVEDERDARRDLRDQQLQRVDV